MSEKTEIYDAVKREILAVLDGETDHVARMATVSCLLSQAFPKRFFWTGFYSVSAENPNELVVGPYQGTLGCLRIPFGQGVCGSAADSGQTQIVEDVHAIENHIACDARSNSEIVVPVVDRTGRLLAVLDVDSTEKAAFDTVDARYLEDIMAAVFAS